MNRLCLFFGQKVSKCFQFSFFLFFCGCLQSDLSAAELLIFQIFRQIVANKTITGIYANEKVTKKIFFCKKSSWIEEKVLAKEF